MKSILMLFAMLIGSQTSFAQEAKKITKVSEITTFDEFKSYMDGIGDYPQKFTAIEKYLKEKKETLGSADCQQISGYMNTALAAVNSSALKDGIKKSLIKKGNEIIQTVEDRKVNAKLAEDAAGAAEAAKRLFGGARSWLERAAQREQERNAAAAAGAQAIKAPVSPVSSTNDVKVLNQ